MLEIKNIAAIGSEKLPVAGKELQDRADRPINNSGASFYRNGYTVITDATVYERSIQIGNNPVKYAVFKTALFDKEGTFIKAGTISTSALVRRLYPTVGVATGMRFVLTPLNEATRPKDWQGIESPKAIADKVIADSLCFITDGIFIGGTAPYDTAKQAVNYDGIVIGDMPTYTAVPCPENVVKFLASEK